MKVWNLISECWLRANHICRVNVRENAGNPNEYAKSSRILIQRFYLIASRKHPQTSQGSYLLSELVTLKK